MEPRKGLVYNLYGVEQKTEEYFKRLMLIFTHCHFNICVKFIVNVCMCVCVGGRVQLGHISGDPQHIYLIILYSVDAAALQDMYFL